MNPGLSYREVAVAGASPVRLVILLYEQTIEDLQRAIRALRRGDVEVRTREIDHALQVLGHLQATLDKERGGKVAQNLEQFYQQIRRGLVEAQCEQSESGLERQIAHLMQVHDAWCAVERDLEPGRDSNEASGGHCSSGDWTA